MGIYGTSLNDSTKVKLINKGSITFVSPFFANAMLCAVKFKSIMFKIGQKVVCVNEENQVNASILGKLNPVKKDYIYTIRKIDSVGGLIFEEFIQGYYFDGEEAGFNPKRFKPLQDNWVDELLSKIMSDVEADELVSA